MKVRFGDGRTSQPGTVKFKLEFDRADVELVETPFGLVVQMDGCRQDGELGGPGLPACVLRVALPPMARAVAVHVESVERELLTEGAAHLAPLQPPRPGARGRVPKKGKDKEEPHHEIAEPIESDEELGRHLPPVPFEPPRPDLYKTAAKKPKPPALLIGDEHIGWVPVALVQVNPVLQDRKGQLELIRSVDLTVEFSVETKDEDGEVRRKLTSRAQAARVTDFARMLVVNPDAVIDFSKYLPELITNVDHLIVTDRQRWNSETLAPINPTTGDPVAEFERLAEWKRKRGLRCRVVTVSDIVSDVYGNFRSGSRDLQEVIRNFLKWAHDRWGVAWVLLGGDVEIVPPRNVAGAAEAWIKVETTDPPEKNRSFWTGSFLKMHVDRPGWNFPAFASSDLVLLNPNTGAVIPYDATGTSGTSTAGWYFTTDGTYSSRSTTATKYIRVNGPSAVVNAELQWIYKWNLLPTDLYYASLVGPNYGHSGAHDWDLLNNGVYGQHTSGSDFDGVEYQADVSVGRAPIATGDQAAAFVNKVIAYESFRHPDGTPLTPSWTERMLFASANWGGRKGISSSSSSPPPDNRYHYTAGSNYSLIKLKDPFETLEWRLLTVVSPTDVRMLPYDRAAKTSGRGWHYAKSDTDLSPSEISFSIFGTTFNFPFPSNWVVVYGPATELAPQKFVFDHITQDGSMRDQEKLRQQIDADFPQFSQVSRLYEDEIDLTPAERAAAPIDLLTGDRVRNSLQSGQHLVSLSGHGSWDGCCGLGPTTADGLTNGYHAFIGYADSCLTNQFDRNDAVSERLVNNAMGGAVAYVGNSRFSWIGVGDDIQREFFAHMKSTRHLGLLADSRCAMLNKSTGYQKRFTKWAIFTLNLIGDPEMPVWVNKPKEMVIAFKKRIDSRPPFELRVRDAVTGLPVKGAVVSLSQGSLLRRARTDSGGRAYLDVRGASLGSMDLTVTRDRYRPHFGDVTVVGPAWVSGLVTIVDHQSSTADSTYVRLELDQSIDGDEIRGWYARDALRDYQIILDAVTDAYVSGKKISLLVQDIDEGGTIERFRFGPYPWVISHQRPPYFEGQLVTEADLRDEQAWMPGQSSASVEIEPPEAETDDES